MTAHPPSDPAAEAVSALREALERRIADILLEGGALSPRHFADCLIYSPLAPLLADNAALRTRAETLLTEGKEWRDMYVAASDRSWRFEQKTDRLSTELAEARAENARLRASDTGRSEAVKTRLSDRDRAILAAVAKIGPDAGSEAVGQALGYKFSSAVEACRAGLNAMAVGGWLTKETRPTKQTRRTYYNLTAKGRAALKPPAGQGETRS